MWKRSLLITNSHRSVLLDWLSEHKVRVLHLCYWSAPREKHSGLRVCLRDRGKKIKWKTGRYAHSAPTIKATLSSEYSIKLLIWYFMGYEVAARAVNQFELKFSQVPQRGNNDTGWFSRWISRALFLFSSFLTLLSLVLHLPRVHVVIPGPYSSSRMAHQQQVCCAPQ